MQKHCSCTEGRLLFHNRKSSERAEGWFPLRAPHTDSTQHCFKSHVLRSHFCTRRTSFLHWNASMKWNIHPHAKQASFISLIVKKKPRLLIPDCLHYQLHWACLLTLKVTDCDAALDQTGYEGIDLKFKQNGFMRIQFTGKDARISHQSVKLGSFRIHSLDPKLKINKTSPSIRAKLMAPDERRKI